MSSFTVLNAFSEDLLDSLRLKPSWEKSREYAYKASIAVIALFVFAIETKFKCMVFPTDDHDKPTPLTKVEAMAIDPYCKIKEVEWYVYYDNLITFGVALITYALSNYWIHLTGVKDKLTDLSELGHRIIELNMNLKDMQYWSSYPITASSKNEHHLLRKCVLTILKHNKQRTLWNKYMIRCYLVFMWTVICSIGAFVLFCKDYSRLHDPVTNCDVESKDLYLREGDSKTRFKCVDESSQFTPLLEIFFGLTLFLQSISMVIALCRECATDAQSDIPNFLIWIMQIDKKLARKIRSFVNFVNSQDGFVKNLICNADEAFLNGDDDFFRILYKITSDQNRYRMVIERVLTRVLRGSKTTNGPICDVDIKVYRFLQNMNWLHCNRNAERPRETSFERRLMNERQWHLLYCTPLAHTDPTFFVEIDFDRLDTEGRSYLFYALRRSSMDHFLLRFDHFNKLMKAGNYTGKTLVHFDGKSMLAEDFYHAEYPEIFRGTLPNFRPCHKEDESETTIERTTDYERICQMYLAGLSNQNAAAVETTSSNLNTIKLTELKSPCPIAENAIRNKHWEVLVALLNAFVVVYKQEIRPDGHDLIGNDMYGLTNSDELEIIFTEALKRPRNRTYYVPTAAEHILSIMSPDMREKAITYVDEAPLSLITKQRLKRLT